jgi:predicted metalloprotease with PDZ domain
MTAKSMGIAGVLGIALGFGVRPLAAEENAKSNPPAEAGKDAKPGRAALGVTLDDKSGTLRILAIRPGSPAEKAGLRAGDTIVAIDSAQVRKTADLQAEIGRRAAGTKIQIVMTRNGEKKSIEATLVAADFHTSQIASRARRMQDLQRQITQLQSEFRKLNAAPNDWPSFEGNGDNGWYYQSQPDDPNQGIQDFGGRARDGQ